jgi:hypothetical protein
MIRMYVIFGLTAIAKLAGIVHGVVVHINMMSFFCITLVCACVTLKPT